MEKGADVGFNPQFCLLYLRYSNILEAVTEVTLYLCSLTIE